MSIGEKISEHRKERNLTQQQLGDIIGMSAQTVSKWENGVAFPNASCIIMLARALHISTDKLLGFNDRRKELEDAWKEALKERGDDPHKLLEISLAALEEYPLDKTFLLRAATDEERVADRETEERSKAQHYHAAMVYARQLLELDPQFETAKELLVRVYSKVGLDDMAIEQAYKCENTDLALKYCLKGDELKRHRQKIINRKLQELLWEMSLREPYMMDISEKIINAVIPDGNYRHYYMFLEGIYLKRACIYAENGDEKAAIATLQKLFELAKSTQEIMRDQKAFTTPLFDMIESTFRPHEHFGVRSFLFALEREFQGLKGNEEFVKILDDASIYIAEFCKSAG